MNIITEHKYEAARWGDLEYDAILSGKFLPGEIIDLHNATLIKLQGDHDEECERLRHQLADASQALTYSRRGKETADDKIRRMSETIREQSARIKELELIKPCKCGGKH